MRNLLTDIAGIHVGHAHDAALASGVTAILFERPAIVSVAVHGGAPGTRETDLLEPDKMAGGADAIVLSGGSAFGTMPPAASRPGSASRGAALRSGLSGCRWCRRQSALI